MQSVKTIANPLRVWLWAFFTLAALGASAQINSPYSRYGMGDLYTGRHALSKGMGGLATPYYDYQTVNFHNPATYSRLQTVTFDLGTEYESRTMRRVNTSERFTSSNLSFNYLTLGFPILQDRRKMTRWGMAFGIRPFSKINFSVRDSAPFANGDSLHTGYRGDGGSYKAFLGTGFRLGGFALGVNAGFLFGQQQFLTQRIISSDSITYLSSSVESKTSFNRFMFDGGMHYTLNLGKQRLLKVGATGYLNQPVKATRDLFQQTFVYDENGDMDSLDVVDRKTNEKGTIELPGGYTAGISLEKEARWMVGLEYESANWNDYRYYGEAGNLAQTSMFRIGGQFTPVQTAETRSYFSRVTYRGGFYTGKDMVVFNNQQLPVWGATFGMALPLRRYNNYTNQFTGIHTSFEFGRRGNNESVYSENFFRLNVGLSLSDIWFSKRQFN